MHDACLCIQLRKLRDFSFLIFEMRGTKWLRTQRLKGGTEEVLVAGQQRII